jgi:predicted nucleotidyltransferase
MNTVVQVPTIVNRTQIPLQAIQSVVDQIASLYHPKKIILFGSYATGQTRPDSDVDLMVIMDTPLTEVEQAVKIARSLKYRFGIDLIVHKPDILAQRLAWGDSFLTEVLTCGKVVYEAPDS